MENPKSEFEKWQEKRAVKTIGYLDGHSAYKAGEKEGWKAALKRVNGMLWLASGRVANEVKERIKDELEKLIPSTKQSPSSPKPPESQSTQE